ncbi:MAG TPA: hypothetical protein DDW33_09315 [Ktedonobacter sp.]|jgi:hypothetical protein|nr:hypothetical protein [Ktedonobacter sp.]HAT47016.1 hypothetical protein [Ktedonobacter sp.]HBE25871.1 hypothetical protein [Ktedonobacter sp.]HBE28425.1 hypothetical protein [Ktedonobacter sp.]HCF85031.1 hypothetical protein [Ktedonobacter sp.]
MILPVSVALSIHHTRFPGALTRQQHAVSFATSGPEPGTHDDLLFPVEPSLPMDRHGSRRGFWLSICPLVLSQPHLLA